MKKTILTTFVALLVAVPAQSAMIAVIGSNSNVNITTFLNSNGHTATDFGGAVPGSLAGFDVVVLLRMAGNATVSNFVQTGGRLITEWDSSVWALNTESMLNATDSGGGFIGTNSPITVTAAGLAQGLGTGLGNPYSDAERTEFDRDITGIGAGVSILATQPDLTPAIIAGMFGSGDVFINVLDWADGFPAGASASGQMLLNMIAAPGFVVIPEPMTMLLSALGLVAIALFRFRT